MKKILFFIGFLAALFTSCDEEFVGQPATDNVKPAKIVNCTVKDIAGGAVIYYEVPKEEEDLLYVKCVYKLHGKECNATASIYNDSLKIEGFGTEDAQQVSLYCVDRSDNYSDPVNVDIHPLIPPIRTIGDTFAMEATFGGVTLTWQNPSGSLMAFYFMAKNKDTEKMELVDIVFSNSKNGKYTLRGFDAEEQEFWCYARDRWYNYSDTIKGVFTPLYEKQIEGKTIKRQELPCDNITDNGSWWAFPKLFDGKWIDSGGWHTALPQKPVLFTIDLGKPVKLSRYVWWHVQPGFNHHNAKVWSVYGLRSKEELDAQRTAHGADENYWTEGFKDDWINVLECEAVPPSGSKNPTPDDQNFVMQNGLQFDFPIDMEPVRYLRFWVQETWGSGKECEMLMAAELQFFGALEDEKSAK